MSLYTRTQMFRQVESRRTEKPNFAGRYTVTVGVRKVALGEQY